MPNYCENVVTIKHPDPLVIAGLVEAFNNGKFFQFVVPMDSDIDMDANSENDSLPNWYNWRVDNWGTKWDIDPTDGNVMIESPIEINLSFNTAWSPPLGVYAKLSEQGFTVDAKYHEYGMMFYGTFTNDEETCSNYESFEEIPADIMEDLGIA